MYFLQREFNLHEKSHIVSLANMYLNIIRVVGEKSIIYFSRVILCKYSRNKVIRKV